MNWREKDRAFLWHPFTQMAAWMHEQAPIVESSDGLYLIDVDGKRYLDGVSSLWCNVHGHRVPALDQALRQQLDRVAHSTMLGLSNVPAIRLAEALVEMTPDGLSRVFYSDNGSTSVEIALKMAFQFWQQSGRPEKTRFLAFENAYHGDTVGSVSLGGIDLFHQVYRPLLFSAFRVPYPYGTRWPVEQRRPCSADQLAPLEAIFAEHGEQIAALVIEPLVQGAAGIYTAPEGFLASVRQLCDRHDVLMIADEVATGFGRTGRMFACEHEQVVPDFLCLSKGLTAGYLPLAATLTSQRVYDAFLGSPSELRTFFHGHTYTGNALACAVAMASIELFEQTRLLEHVGGVVDRLEQRLPEFLAIDHVVDVRQRGLMVGIELANRPGESYAADLRMGHQVVLAARRRGVIIRPLGDTVVLMPPLAISLEQLDGLLEVVAGSIVECTE